MKKLAQRVYSSARNALQRFGAKVKALFEPFRIINTKHKSNATTKEKSKRK